METRPPIVIWLVFAFLIAGVNLINPLLPTIRSDLDVTTGGLAALYSLYLIALVPLLLLVPRMRWTASPRLRLFLSVGLTALSDVLHMVGDPVALGLGRIVLALGIALGTGAVAELAVLTAGSRGRTVTATANTAGALIGTVFAGGGLFLASAPIPVVFLGHAAVALVLLAWMARRLPVTGPRVGTTEATAHTPLMGGRLDGVVLGAFAFAAGSGVIVLGPSLFEQVSGVPLGGRALMAPTAMFLAAALAQSRVTASLRTIHVGGVVTLTGLGLMLWSLVLPSFPILVLSAAVTGVGFGVVFMLGLAWTTHNAHVRSSASLASTYACTAYASAAIVTTACGYVADVAGAPAAILVILLVTSVAFIAWAIRARSFRDRFEPGDGLEFA